MFLESLLAASMNFYCLVDSLYHEARGLDRSEQIMVGVVIHNRMVDSGSDHCSVVTEPYQFSYLNGREIGDLPMTEEEAKQDVMEVAYMVYMLDPRPYLHNIQYYHGGHMTPNWDFSKLEHKEKYDGHHIFYKDAQ